LQVAERLYYSFSWAKYLTIHHTHPKYQSSIPEWRCMLLFGCTPDTTVAAGYLRRPCFLLPALPSLCYHSRPRWQRRHRQWSPTYRDSMTLFPSTWRPGKVPPPAGRAAAPVDVVALLRPIRLNFAVVHL
jgi:hypothetical protein